MIGRLLLRQALVAHDADHARDMMRAAIAVRGVRNDLRTLDTYGTAVVFCHTGAGLKTIIAIHST